MQILAAKFDFAEGKAEAAEVGFALAKALEGVEGLRGNQRFVVFRGRRPSGLEIIRSSQTRP